MTDTASQAIADFLILADLERPFSFRTLFEKDNPVELEIGAGRGDFLVDYCRDNPDVNLVAVERKLNYLKRGINKARQADLTNVSFLNVEARHFMEEYVPANSLRAVHLYFPDPWPKKRHLKRRLFQDDFVKLLAEKIVTGGALHLRTDHSHYFEQMMEVMSKQSWFRPVPVPDSISQYKTGFEKRFTQDGIGIHYASYILSSENQCDKGV